MISIDTNILLYAYSKEAPAHEAASLFLNSLAGSQDVALSEFVLTELYILLRNPAVLVNPLTAPEAVAVIQAYRRHPLWRIIGFPPNGKDVHDRIWELASRKNIARRRIYDLRIALTLRAFGVTGFATANLKDFESLSLFRVFNPLV